jgi:tetratricopeptide (TPR) repeat protein
MDRAIRMDHLRTHLKSIVRTAAILAVCAALPACLNAQPTKPCDVQGTLARVEGLLKLQHYADARIVLKRLQTCHGLSQAAVFKIGLLYEVGQDPLAALAVFQSLPIGVPDRATHQYAIAVAEFDLGAYAKTVETLKSFQSDGPLDSRSANLLGVAYSKLGAYEAAFTALSDNLEQNPADLTSYLNLITVLSDAGRFGQAAEVATQAVAAFPGNADVLVARGSVYTQLGQLETAKRDFAAAIELAPHQVRPHLLLALSEFKLADFQGASASLRVAIQSGAVDSDIYYLLAECLLKIDPANAGAAISELNRAIALNGNSVQARTLRGKLLLESGQVKEAFADLSLAHQLAPASRSAAYNLARAETKLGMTQQANALFKKFHTPNGDSPDDLDDPNLQKAPQTGEAGSQEPR